MQKFTQAAGVSVANSGPAMSVSVNIRAVESQEYGASVKMDQLEGSWATWGGLGPWKTSMRFAEPQAEIHVK